MASRGLIAHKHLSSMVNSDSAEIAFAIFTCCKNIIVKGTRLSRASLEFHALLLLLGQRYMLMNTRFLGLVGGALEEPKAAEVSRCILEIG